MSLGSPKAIAENIKDAPIDLDLYSIDEGCPLNEPQLNVYLDIIANEKTDSYLIPLKMNISKKYSIDTIFDGLNEISNVHPILKMCINDSYSVPYLVKGNSPEIIVKNDADKTFINNFLNKGFDLEKSLCKFLINEKTDEYELFGVFHHIIFDGLSEPVFKNDLLNILDGDSIDMDDSFLKISAFNQQIQKTNEYSEAKDYYDTMLTETDEIGTLLNDVSTDKPGMCKCNLDIDLKQFNKFISENYINENVLFTSVFAYTLSRFAGNDKVLFNIVENGRDRFNNFNSIGMFVNTLPILADCKNQAVSTFIDSMSDLIYSAMRYNYYPFRLLANEYNIDAEILFQYQPDWFNENRNDDLDNEDLIKDSDDLICDLNVDVNQKGDNYTINIVYSDKYCEKTISKIIKTYKLILSQIINVNNLSDINYITEEDLELLDDNNKTEHDLKYNDILDAFNDNLSKCPDNKLVSYNDNIYTYAEGAFIADKIAKKLIESGVKPQDHVSFLVDRSEQYMTCVLAILSTGSVFVPLDDAHPDERIEFILKDTDSKAIIVDDTTYKRAKQLTEDNTIILNISDIVNGEIGTLDKLDVCYNEVASILYTSGSTGVPKGVKVTRKAILNVAEYYADKYDLNSDDVYALYPSIGFDAGCESIFKAIYAGSCLSIVPQDIRLNMAELNSYFIKQNVTHTMITTQVGKLFMETNENTSLKYLFVGGEKLGEVESPKEYILVDEYGPTETNNFITSINNANKIDYSSVGYLNYNSKYYILDSDSRRVPIGAVGELYLAGYQVSQGYINREKETEESFLNNPFNEDEDYSKLYRTGDLVRVLPDGSLGIVGRRDGQVKIRGNRVELSEVESTIRDIKDVEDVTVQTIDNEGNKELVAYIVTSNNLEDDALVDYIQSHVNKYKPDYMVPSYVVRLDEIPINVNGKVNRKALPEVDLKNLRAEYVAPTNKTEEDLVKAFEEVFNLEKVSIYDDFIKLGGDSLTAIKLNSSLKDYNISAADILSLHTPKAIASNITKKSFNLNKYSSERGCPLNEPQLNVYLDIIANDKTDSYLIPINMDISKKYSIDDLHDALNEMVKVHPILKMRISDKFKVPYLVKGEGPEILTKNDIDDKEINGFVNKGFDLHERLCRFLIVEKADKYELIAVFHHLIFDGLSKSVFKRDLLNILDNKVVDKDESYLKVSAFHQEIQKTEEYDIAKGYFDMMLCDVDEVSVLLDDISSDGSGMCTIELNNNIKEFIDKNNIHENALFTGVFAYTLSRFTGDDKVLFNIVENGRDRFDNFDSIGMYVNTLPLLVDCKNQASAEFITYIFDLIYDVMRYNYYPFRLLANEYDINSNIIFQYMPDWIGDFSNDKDIEDNMLNDMSDFISDFNVNVIQNGDNYSLNIMYSNKYSKNTMMRFAETYNLILSQIIEVNNLSDINYITSSDLELLDSYNKTETEFEYGDILEKFNENLAEYEDNILVGYNDISYTHGESAFIANEIADQLKNLGIEKQDFVALFVDRSEWFLLASLGVLTSGAIYVPIEAHYPEDRIILMLKDTNSGVVIVTDETEKDILDIIADNNLDINVLNVSNMIKSGIESSNQLNIVSTDDEDIGCVLYTSGTTGTPKGTLITRKAINNFISWYVDETSFTSEDIYGMHCSYVFDIHTAALYAPVITGGSLYVVPEEIRLDLKALNEYYVEHGCTHTYITSQVGKLFAESGMETTIKLLCFGGMKLGELNAPDSIGPFETYGPSENLAVSTSIFANKRIHHTSIGRFISNVKGYVLDDERRRVPLGAVGELYLAGAQLTPGYLNREEENAKSFFENQFDDEEGYEYIYSTGDMVRFLPDGTLAIVDRRDSQVKIRGNRVELPEVESAIRKIRYVDDVTVQVANNNGSNELVAYVVASKEFAPDSLAEYVREYVSKHKPDYMVPSFIMPLNKIPLNVNGKVDKKALPKVNLEHLHAKYVAPVTKAQKIIAETFENVLNQDRISLYDDFIRLGGDSIKAIRVISLLQSKNISCSAQDILNYKTPYLISKNIESVSKVSYDAVEGIVDLHPIQSYFFDQINKNEFNQHFILKANQTLDLNALQKAFDKLSNIHDMLRAKYRFEDNKPIQEIRPVNTRVCEINEIYSENDINETLMDIFMDAPNSLNVENNLMQIYLIHHNNESYVMFIIHHLIIDGVSWSILIDDLSYLYYKIESGREIDLIRPYPYKLWVDNIKELANNISEEEKQHWMKINNSLDDSEICGPSTVFSFKTENQFNPDNIMGLTEEEYLALAIARAYKKTYGKNIIFNRESHGREERLADVSRTIGWFTSQYPVELDLINGEDNISLMLDVYKLKEEFKNINDLGLNYGSLIYLKNELEYKHCPVTFNFLSTEFIFKNKLFESLDIYLSDKDVDTDIFESDSYGITMNIAKVKNGYILGGDYAKDTYLGDKYPTFIENIKLELDFIENYQFDDGLVCCLSEPQWGIYLDEKVHDKGTAYANPGFYECDLNCPINEITAAVDKLIEKHPILKGRIVDNENMPLLVCDSYPQIKITNEADFSKINDVFDLNKSLARFYIVDDGKSKIIYYNIHHIISDATTKTVINDNLNDILNKKSDSKIDTGFIKASLDAFESKYKNTYEETHDFFNDQFNDLNDITELLEDIDGHSGIVTLPVHGIREQMERFAHENGITIGSLLNAIFAYTYSRFIGNDKVYFNFTEHGRHEEYSQNALGMFVRTIPLVINCKNTSVKEYLNYVSDLILDSMIYSVYPYRLLANEFDLNNNVCFEYNHDLNDISDVEDGINIEDIGFNLISDLLCVIYNLDDGYLIKVEHSNKFSRKTMIRFVKAYKEVLTQIFDKNELSDINYVCDEDLKLLDEINETEHKLKYNDVLDAFNDNLSRYPNNNFVSFKDKTYSYEESAFIANKIAEKLKEMGVKINDPVGFLTERSEYYMFSILAILSIGATYVPLDDAHPDNRLSFILNDTQSKVVIVSDETEERASNLDSDCTILNVSEIINDAEECLTHLPVVYGELACILYTSGTTGIPKGVKITRKSIVNYIEYYIDKSNMTSEDTFALYASIGFDVGAIKSIFVSLFVGACLNIIPEEIRLDMNKLNEHFINNNITHAHLPTQVAKLFINEFESSSLKILVTGGEKLGEIDYSTDYMLVDSYGPTEACVSVTAIKEENKINYSSIGHLLYNIKAYVLDNERRRVPVGAVGELYLAGYQIADGYLNREKENNEAFIDNPFDENKDYGVLYRSGDMVRVLDDGTLAIVGRRDNQVKIRGNRVELPEIESIIREINYVEDVTVQTIKRGSNYELVAYVVESKETDNLDEIITKHIGKSKPEYMIPSFIVKLEKIPLNNNGKVDKKALPEIDPDSLHEKYVAPATKTEKDIVEAFEKTFNIEKISVYDDFTKLGGDSLTAIKLTLMLKEYNISAADVLSLRTPKNIAENISQDSYDLDVYSLESGCPLNEPQLNVYLDIIAQNKINAYKIQFSIQISKEYSPDRILDAMNEMVDIHPILKTHISNEFETPYLVNGRKPDIILESEIDNESVNEFLNKPFDLEDSLCRFIITENKNYYELFASFHHIIFDALSHNVFKKDLFKILDNEEIEIDKSFLEVSAFNQQIQKTEEYKEAGDFYDSMLADAEDAGILPNDKNTDGPGTLIIDLGFDKNLINKFAMKYSISENILFTGIFAYTLSRFTGSDTNVFNVIDNGRSKFNNFNAIGMYVNTLPLLIDCKNKNIQSYMDSVSHVIYDVMKYNYYPFRVLAKKYNVDSNIIFQYIPDWVSGMDESVEVDNNTENVDDIGDLVNDFSAEVIQNGNDYILRLKYCEKYSKDMIERFGETYKLVLSQITNYDCLSDINIIAEEDLKLLDDINKTEHELEYDDILDAFNNNLSEYPENKLVSYKNRSYTYGEGAFIADKIAKQLKELDVEAEDNIAFLVERNEYYMFNILAVLSIGCCYVPLDGALPDEHLEFILDDSNAKVLIVSDETYERSTDLINDDVTILNISNILKEDTGVLSTLPVVYNDLACILYTSGTTGIPKGVKVTRKSILNIMQYYEEKYGITRDDVYGLYATIGFDAGTLALGQCIYSGSCLSVIPEDIKLNIKELNDYLIKQGVTHTMMTTQVGKLFMENTENNTLKVLLVGGEKLGEYENNNDYQLVDGFGPTETFSFVTSIKNDDKIDYNSIGFLNYNTKAYILDNDLRRVPIGAIGELCISGYQVAAGYLNRDEETDKAFIDNAFDDNEEYNVLYRTGDMVRVLPDKSLAIVGRRDSQVKIRGNRVELSEIESIIREIDYVEDVTVQTIKHGSNYELVAYVVSSTETDNLDEIITKHIGKSKPEYMIPSFIVKLDKIPLNNNGKVDKKALPEVDLDSLHGEYVAPATKTEKDIVEAFEKTFNIEKISIYDDFSKLGGDSLTAIKLISHLDDYTISAAEILSLKTPKAIADNIKGNEFDLDIYDLESGCPLNESQLNVYLDIIANNKVDSYLIMTHIDIPNTHSLENICNALNEMINVHPILNMRISNDYEVPYLVKGSKPEILVESEYDEDSLYSFLTSSFDLYDSLCRFLIIKNDKEYSLFAVFHHIIVDGLSKGVFKNDLMKILNNEKVDIDTSFLKVAAFNQQIKETEEYEDADKFYASQLSDNDNITSLLEDINPNGPGNHTIDLEIDTSILNEFLENNNISENILFTSIFAYTLSRFTGNDKTLFNITENGRDRYNNLNSIGMYVTTLPLLIDCQDQSISSFIKHASEIIYKTMQYNFYPFRELVNKYDINSNILFQYLPEWFNHDLEKRNDSNINIISNMNDTIADLNVDIINNNGNYRININYGNKYSRNTIARLCESYKLITSQIMESEKLSDLDYTSERDIEILDKYNQTENPLDYSDILDAFNDNLSKYPNNKLVSYNDVSYTYGEGAFIAREIAEKLVNLGVEPQDCVGFLVPRSELYLLSVLSIMSLGGVYVPLDDALPDDRLSFMIKDTQSKVVIVNDETEERASNLDNGCAILNISEIINDASDCLTHLPVAYGDLACILYTSGTTGIPKGVKITRKSIVNYIEYYADKSNMTQEDAFALYASIGFDVGAIKSIFVSLFVGACLNIIPEEIRLDMKKLNEHFINCGVTHAHLPTQVAKLFINEFESSSLKILVTGGEKLGEIDYSTEYILVDSYGPTEACVSITAIKEQDKIDYSSIGHLLYNIKAYVLDDERRRVPLGAVGELYLAGYQIADGYLNREKENNEAFLDNPFEDNKDYGVLYRSGDMVRVLDDGTLGIVGRRDKQVKIRGNRVELSEIEAAIRELPQIEDVTLQTIKNANNNELAAYVVANCEVENINDLVCDYVNEHKPDYMVPSYVIQLDEIPLNVNGKVDKKALPDIDLDALRVEYVAPTNETEKVIVDAFEVVFNQKGIGLNDDFVHLGGDSITAIRVIALLEKNNISCTARDILNHKTPYLIAQNVDSAEIISYDTVEGEVDLLPIQSFYFDQIKSDEYMQPFFLKSKEKIEKNVLQSALNELTNLHDMLRASYKIENGKAVQEIMPVNTCVCEINEHEITDNFKRRVEEIYINSVKSLNILNNLIEINLIHYNDESYIICAIHHLIIDGVSWNILINDLTSIYYALKAKEEIEIPKAYPYKYWVEDVKELVENISDDEKEHWIKINKSLDDSNIKGKTQGFKINTDINYDADNILNLSEEEYLALAIARAYKKTYDEDIIFNRESYGRDEDIANLTRTIGWFTSQYPVQVKTNNGYDDISLVNDVYRLKTAFNEVNNLGLNYASLIYTTNELEFKNCPVTFNFLSTEFEFENELFESFEISLSGDNEIESESYGISLNVSRLDDSYVIGGIYAENTYIGDGFDLFIENIKEELDFIGNYKNENIVCCLSEVQTGLYLDEKMNDKGIAYAGPGFVECDSTKSINEIKDAIYAVIDRHPVLKSRIVDTEDMPLIICDSYPSIKVVEVDNHSELVKPFNLNESLVDFYIIDDSKSKEIFYNIHHIITDATTRTIITKDLNDALNGELDDSVDLGFVRNNNELFKSKYESQYKSAYNFFKEKLADVDEIGALLDEVDGEKGSVILPIRGIRDCVEDLTHELGITVSNLLNAVFAYTYSRFTGTDKVYYTFTENGRHRDYLENAVGMYVNTIPIIIDCKNKAVDEYLNDVSDLILESMSNTVYPFRLLRSEFDLNNDVIFEYNYDLNDVSDVGDEIIYSDKVDSVSDIICVVNDLDDGYAVNISHSDNHSKNTIGRFAKVFKEVLTQILDKDNLSDIAYTPDSDISLLDSYNETEHKLKYSDVLEAFNDNLTKNPEGKLVSYNDASYTYSQGAFIANEIAESLKGLGIESQDNVAFLTERSELYMFSILGVLSAGAVYVPLDDAHPDERIKFILEDIDAKAVIVSDKTYERAKHLSDKTAILNISDIMNKNIGDLSELTYSYGELACILYTSGTTGIPKGVKITRKSILNLSEFYIRKFNLNKEDTYALFASIGFDVAIKAVFPSICAGACLTVVPDEIKLNMNAMNDYFITNNVTHTEISTQVAKLFTEQIDNTSLKVLTTGGEKLGKSEIDADYRFIDSYGPTEACVDVTSIDIEDKIDYSSIGYLLDNTKAYILDDEQRRLPIGAVGELYVAGYQIAKSYLNRDEETEKAFIDNPFDDNDDYATLYRTGDMVRLLPDGSLAIIGRHDKQVKIRGNRVELQEVEAVIRKISFVNDVTVQTMNNRGNNELIAYVVTSNEMEDGELKNNTCDFVRDNKPNYMIPSHVIRLDSIPLTVNGKVDKNALPKVDRDTLLTEYVAPRTETEKIVVETFEKVFNQEQISLYDDFISIGGDSIIAIKMVSILAKENIQIDARSIFNSRTPYEIARVIDGNKIEYGFNLVKKGKKDQNMFIFPPLSGLSFQYSQLINKLEFEGNVYLIDDYKYDLPLEEIRKIDSLDSTLEMYYDAIKDVFQDGDIIVGYSLGCVFASLITERLEKTKTVGKCILIDGALIFDYELELNKEDITNSLLKAELNKLGYGGDEEFTNKIIEVIYCNRNRHFHDPKINSPVIYLDTRNLYRKQLAGISSNYKLIPIDSTHADIIKKDADKIIKYLK